MSIINYYSSALLPPVEYFVRILNSDKIIIEQYEHYLKQTYRNRCYIYGPNGKQPLSIPVSKEQGNKTLIKDISISYHSDWQTLHWRSIETAYNSSPYFLYYMDEFLPFFMNKYEKLIEYNTLLLKKVMELIGIKKEIIFTESFVKQDELSIVNDFRYSISPKTDFNLQSSVYYQVFNSKYGFIPNLSIIDLIFNLGPDSLDYLNSCKLI